MTSSVSPVHSIHEYGNGIYKVVTFKGVRDPDNAYFRQSENVQHNDKKLDNNFSRARNMVLQYALCNPWDYFFTGTIDRAKFDRFDLDTYDDFSGVTALPDGNWYVTWTGAAQFVAIGYNQSSQFFVHMSNLVSQMGEQQSMYLSGIDGSLKVLLAPEETGAVNLFTLENSLTSIETALSNLSFDVGDVTVSPTDLTDVVGRMDTIIDLLQNTAGDAACEHIYKQEMTTDATCTLPGLLVSTCSKCGDSYSEIVDPLGHDWKYTDHVAAVTDPETGEETAAAYDIYTCSRCGDTYNDYSGEGAPEDYSNTSISRLIVELFSRLGKLAGSLVAFVVNAFDKALTSVDNIISKFNSYTEQIAGFGGTYPAWLGGLWGILPVDLQVALTFAVVCMAVALVGKKLVFS